MTTETPATHDELYEALLDRGFHEDFLDDATTALLVTIYESGRRGGN